MAHHGPPRWVLRQHLLSSRSLAHSCQVSSLQGGGQVFMGINHEHMMVLPWKLGISYDFMRFNGKIWNMMNIWWEGEHVQPPNIFWVEPARLGVVLVVAIWCDLTMSIIIWNYFWHQTLVKMFLRYATELLQQTREVTTCRSMVLRLWGPRGLLFPWYGGARQSSNY